LLVAPVTDRSTVTVDGAQAGVESTLAHGTHDISVTKPAIARRGPAS
jgi:hypothetical protein